jgi:GH24 family phage-related lysozyme (muramidase)
MNKWDKLSMQQKADLMKIYVKGGVTNIGDIRKHYNSFGPGGYIERDEYGYPADITPAVVEADYPREAEVWKRADASNADMIQRLKQGSSRETIPDWEYPEKVATHKMMSAGNYVIGNVQNINGKLIDFTDPKYGFKDSDRAAIDSAIERGDYVKFDTEGDARYFAEHYKKHYNSFGDGGTSKNVFNGVNAFIKDKTILPDNYVEKDKNTKYLNESNYLTEHAKFREAFEEYYPKAYWDNEGKKYTIGTGLTYIIDDKGREIPIKKGDIITKEENQRQLALREKRMEEYIKKKTSNWDNYHPELKFQILDGMFNAGANNVWNKSPKYQKALREYELAEGWKDPDYDLSAIFKHADWNLNDNKWLGVRSRMRRNPQAINPEDYKLIYKNQYRDSLSRVYNKKFEDLLK